MDSTPPHAPAPLFAILKTVTLSPPTQPGHEWIDGRLAEQSLAAEEGSKNDGWQQKLNNATLKPPLLRVHSHGMLPLALSDHLPPIRFIYWPGKSKCLPTTW
jgi:hypothetical protein